MKYLCQISIFIFLVSGCPLLDYHVTVFQNYHCAFYVPSQHQILGNMKNVSKIRLLKSTGMLVW